MRGAHMIGSQSHEETAAQVVAEYHGAQQLLSGPIFTLRDGHCRRHNGASRMCFRDRFEIIRLVRMGEHPGRKRCVYR